MILLVVVLVVLPVAGGVGSSGEIRAAPRERSVVTLRRGAVKVYAAARRRAPRRGIIGGRNAVFPLLGRVKAKGCRRPWLKIAPEAFVCSARLRTGRGQPRATRHPSLRKGRTMPRSYFVTRRLATVRTKPSATAPRVRILREHSGIVARGKVRTGSGVWRRTRRGYLPASVMRFVRPSKLAGVVLGPKQKLPISWVNGATARVMSRPTLSRRARVGRLSAYARVTVHELRKVGRRRFVRIGNGRWVQADRVRTARLRKVPAGIGAAQKWIHVSIKDWTLVAYVGARPVFAALISRGYKTPRGRFRVTRKLAMATMRFNTRKGEYEAEAVPWVIYFKPRYAFHAAYWHDGFGSHASHGCINLSPRDARWLFEWTAPDLPPGWFQIYQTTRSRGTHVLIE
jgi:L,D-transpeptidase catalytic domain